MSESPSFFKVLYGDFLYRLQIPPAFVKNLGGLNGAFPHEYSLRDSGGRRWRVEINSHDNNLYFDDGWKDFMEDNSLEIGDFLVFRCHGSSEFFVRIYERSGCEKEVEFDLGNGGVEEGMFTGCGEEDAGSETWSDDIGLAARLGSRKQEKKAGNAAGGVDIKELPSRNGSRNQTLSSGAAHPKLPLYNAIMRSSCLHSGKMIMPSYLRDYAKHQQSIKLKYANRTWTATFLVYDRVCLLCRGWPEFVKDNKLQMGNICTFELIDVEDVTLAVSIVRHCHVALLSNEPLEESFHGADFKFISSVVSDFNYQAYDNSIDAPVKYVRLPQTCC